MRSFLDDYIALNKVRTQKVGPHPAYPNNPDVLLTDARPSTDPPIPLGPIKRHPGEEKMWADFWAMNKAVGELVMMLELLKRPSKETRDFGLERIARIIVDQYSQDENAFNGVFFCGEIGLIKEVDEAIGTIIPGAAGAIINIREQWIESHKPFTGYSDQARYDPLPIPAFAAAEEVRLKPDGGDQPIQRNQPAAQLKSWQIAGKQFHEAVCARPELAGDVRSVHAFLVETLGADRVANLETFKRYLNKWKASQGPK